MKKTCRECGKPFLTSSRSRRVCHTCEVEALRAEELELRKLRRAMSPRGPLGVALVDGAGI